MLSREQKEEIVSEIKDGLNRAQAVFLTNLIGITANDSVRIRKSVREAGGKVLITRNSLYKKASQGTELEKLFTNIKGPHALAFAFKDPTSIAKIIFDASKELEPIQLKSGALEGKILKESEVEALAKLPSRDQMLATLLATFNAPVSAFVRVLDQIRVQKDEGKAA